MTLPHHWKLKPVGEVCAEIVDCINKTAPTVDGPTPYKMIRTTNVRHGRVSTEENKYVDEKTYQKWTRRSAPKLHDIVLTREAPLGEVGLIRTNGHLFLGQRTMMYRADEKKATQLFLYYAFQGGIVQSQILSWGSGATVEHLRVPDASKFKVPLPELAEQRKIAAILTAYDDLIENNRQRIALLENMAEEIYREWFVRLRFPGHEHTPVHKGVPEGWCRAPIGALAALVKRGISPRYDDESDMLVLNQKCIRNGSIDLTPGRKHSTNTPDKKFVQLFDVLVNSTGVGTLGRTAIVDFSDARITVDSHITICRADDQKIEPLYFGFTIKLFEAVFENLAAGATGQTELSASLVKRLEIFKPPQPLQEKFADLLQPMLRGKHILAQQNAESAKTRDLLLNRLISGKLRVDDLDIQFPPSMQEAKAA